MFNLHIYIDQKGYKGSEASPVLEIIKKWAKWFQRHKKYRF